MSTTVCASTEKNERGRSGQTMSTTVRASTEKSERRRSGYKSRWSECDNVYNLVVGRTVYKGSSAPGDLAARGLVATLVLDRGSSPVERRRRRGPRQHRLQTANRVVRPREAGPPSCPARGLVPCRPPLPGSPSLLTSTAVFRSPTSFHSCASRCSVWYPEGHSVQ
eukprot:1178347-Prorocentrum_minimum.AAC.1